MSGFLVVGQCVVCAVCVPEENVPFLMHCFTGKIKSFNLEYCITELLRLVSAHS